MRKTLATLAALSAALVVLSACGSSDSPSGAPASAVASTASSEPTADTSGEAAEDGGAVAPADITGLKVTRAEAGYPAGTIAAEFTAVNSGAYACTFALIIGIFDGSGTQVAGIPIDSSESGPTTPGGRVHVTGHWAAIDNHALPTPFRAEIIKAERVPA